MDSMYEPILPTSDYTNPGDVVTTLVYDDALDTTAVQNVILIDCRVSDFNSYSGSNSFPIIYYPSCTREDMLALLERKFSDISRIAFVSHFSDSPTFLSDESLFSESNTQFIIDVVTQFNVSHIDYLACNTLQSEDWRNYYAAIYSVTEVIIGASDNNTGNIKYGGDWIMESTQEDISAIYFNDSIQNYASLLLTVNIDNLGSTLTYTYTVGVNNASVTAWVSGASVTIPSTIIINSVTYNVTSIGNNLFYNNTSLTSITIPGSVTTINSQAFLGCTNLTSVTFSTSGLVTIGTFVFQNCTKLASVTLPSGLSTVGHQAFIGCGNMTSITIPSSVTSIGNQAFSGCVGLTSITLPVLTTVGVQMFQNCTGLASVTFPTSGITSLSNQMFINCPNLTSIILPIGLTSIGTSTFQSCTKLASVTLPNELTTIGIYAFRACPGLTSISLSTTKLTTISANAFDGCSSLTSVTLPSTLTTISGSAFIYCALLTQVNFLHTTLPTITAPNFFKDASTTKVNTAYYNSLVPSTTAISSFFTAITPVISKSVTVANVNYTTNITEAMVSVSGSATGAIIIPSTITDASGVTYPVTSIVASAFQNCTGLTSVTLPSSLTTIGANAFTSCSLLTQVNFLHTASLPTIISPNFFKAASTTKVNTAYYNSVVPYTSAISSFFTTITPVISKSITISNINYTTNITEATVAVNASATGEVTIPSTITDASGTIYTVTSIVAQAFQNCTGLTSITIPSSVTSIRASAFVSCTLLTQVNFLHTVSLPTITGPNFFKAASTTKVDTAYYNPELLSTTAISSFFTTITPTISYAPPAAPTSLVVTPGDTQLSVAFTAGSSGGIAITNYKYSLNGGEFTALSPAYTASPVVITGLTNGTSYTVALKAINATYDGSVSATTAASTPYTNPAAPTSLVVTPGDTQLSVAFTAGASNGGIALTNYKYSLNGGAYTAFSSPITSSPVVITGLTNGTSYTVALKAVNATVDGSVSETTATYTPYTSPAAPISLVVTPGNAQLSVAFTAGSSGGIAITNYKYSLNGGEFTALSPAYTTSPVVITGLTNGTSYTVALKAINATVDGSVSETTAAYTPGASPDAPTDLVVTPGNTQLSVAFTAGSDGGASIMNYKYSTDGTNYIACSPAVTASPVVITGLTNGTSYTIYLKAVNTVDSPASESVTSTPVSFPSAPTITSIVAGDGSATVNFTAGSDNGSSITDYNYSIDNGSTWTTRSSPSTSSPIVITSLSNGTEYSIKILAVNAVGTGVASTVTTVTPVAVPAAPTLVNIVSGNASATINFTANSDNGSTITNYKYSLNNGSTWTTRSPASDTSPIELTGLTNGTTYTVKILALNAVGDGAASTSLTVVPATNPNAPTINSVIPGDASATVNFGAGDSNGSAITNYKYSKNGGTTWFARDPSSNSSPIELTGLTNGTTYSIKILAVNAVGDGEVSNAVSVTPVLPRFVPARPTITSIVVGDNSATINFTAGSDNGDEIINYKYSIDDGANWIARTPISVSSPIELTGLTNGSNYSIKILAINIIGDGAASDAVSANPVSEPDAPTITSLVRGNGSATINFTAGFDNGPDITNYKYSLDNGSTWVLRSPVSTTSPIELTELTNGSTYSVKILAINSVGDGAESNMLSVTPATYPQAPIITTISTGDGSASVNFDAGANQGSAVSNYKYSIDGGSTWTTFSPAVTSSPLTITGLTNGTTYSIKIIETNDVGDSPASNGVSVTPVLAPGAPNVSSIVAGDASIAVNFTAGSSNGAAITNYKYSTNNGTTWTTRYPVSLLSPISITKLVNGTSYSVRILAVNSIGDGTASTAVPVTPAAIPSAPIVTTVLPGHLSASVYFTAGSDNGAAITNYKYSSNGGSTWSEFSPAQTSSPLRITGLSNGTSYSIKILAINSIGDGASSNALPVVPAVSPPTAPVITSIVPSNLTATIHFTEADNNGSAITNYQYSINNGSKWIVPSPAVTSSPLVVGKLVNGTPYSVKILAVNGLGPGAQSAMIIATPAAVPAVPTKIVVVSGDSRATINFTPGVNNGAAISNYKYSLDGGSNWTACSPAVIASPVVITGLSNGTSYSVKLLAVNVIGDGIQSAATTVIPSKAPEAPTITSITRGNLSASINISAGDSNGATIANYKYSLDNGTTWVVRAPASATSPIALAKLKNGTSYSIKIKAVNLKGDSAVSNMVTVIPAIAPAVPTKVTVLGGDNRVTVNFVPSLANGSAVTNYKYFTDASSSGVLCSPAQTVSPLVITGLTNGTSYAVKILAVNDVGDGVASAATTVIPAKIPDAPTLTSVDRGVASATVNFTAGASNGAAITNYSYSLDDGTKWLVRAPVSTASPIAIAKLVNGTTYSVKLRAVNSKGQGVASNMITVKPGTVPDAPKITTAVSGNTTATVNFTAGKTNGGYAITNYKYSIDNGANYVAFNTQVTASPLVITGLTNGTTCSVKILAVNDVGDGLASNMIVTTPSTVPSAATITSVVRGSVGATVNFDAPESNGGAAITNYKYSLDNGTTWLLRAPASSAGPLVLAKLVNGTTYSVKIKAVNLKGDGTESNMLTVKPGTVPAVPKILTVLGGNGSATVNFTAGSTDGGYAITNYKYSLNNGTDFIACDPAVTATPIVITGLTNGTAYSVKILPVNDVGDGLASNMKPVTPN